MGKCVEEETADLHDPLDAALGEGGATEDFVLVLLRVGEGRHQQLHLLPRLSLLLDPLAFLLLHW